MLCVYKHIMPCRYKQVMLCRYKPIALRRLTTAETPLPETSGGYWPIFCQPACAAVLAVKDLR